MKLIILLVVNISLVLKIWYIKVLSISNMVDENKDIINIINNNLLENVNVSFDAILVI